MANGIYKIRMMTASAFDRYKIGMLLLILMAGIILGFFMFTFFLFLPNTYATFVTFGLMIPLLIVIVGSAKRFLLAILIICLPITVDISLGDTGHIGGTAGYLLSLFDIVLAGLYLFWLLEILGKKNIKVSFFPQISVPAFCLILMAALSMVFSRFPKFGRFEIIEVLKMYFCFFYLANNIKSKNDVKFIVVFLLLGLLFEGVLGFAQHRYGDPFWPTSLGGPKRIEGSRIYGSWMSFNDFGWYIGLILPISFSVLFSKIRVAYKFLLGFTFFLGSGSLMWTASRGAWISFGAGALFVGICVFSKIRGKTGLIKVLGWIMVIAIFVSPLYPRLWAKIYERLGGPDRGSAESRLPQFEIAYNMIKDNPLVGVGINTYTEVMDDYDTTEEGIRSYTRHPVHNIFLHIAAEMGVFGLAVFFWLICAIFVEGMKHIISNEDFTAYAIIGMIGGTIAFLIHGLVDTASLGSKLYMFVWFFAGIIFAVRKIKPAANLASENPS
jgi:putative inorganic carbon (HCO3(-)) transporter